MSPLPVRPSCDQYSTNIHRCDTDAFAAMVGLPWSVAEPALVTYRSAGIGVFGVIMRFIGMPLEKIALFMNPSQVSGRGGQFRQATRLAFKEGALAPYCVVGPSSITAWFFQYSVMGFAFQFFDHGLSKLLKVKPVYYGRELMEPPALAEECLMDYRLKSTSKTTLSPVLAAALETKIANWAEVQRFFGKDTFAKVMTMSMAATKNPCIRVVGPAFTPCMMRHLIMCQTSFILTPITYKLYVLQDMKNKSSLFWYGLGMHICIGSVVAITEQALWGRSLDYLAIHGQINYAGVICEGLQKEGISAFFTGSK